MALKAQNKALNSEEILARKVRLKSKPVFFSFAICGPCNLECVHCGYRLFGRTSEQQVSEEVYSQAMSELMPTAYQCHLGGSNWGEMTIAKNFHRFLLDAKKFGVGINLTTNGTRMLDDWFNDLLDTLSVIGFSMEGMNEEFEKVRGFKWRHFLKNVEKLCQGRADRGKNFRVEWRYCAHAGSIHQLPDMIRLARSVGVDRIQMMNLIPFIPSQKYWALSYHRSLANHWFAVSRKVASELNFEINIPDDLDVGEASQSLLVKAQPNAFPSTNSVLGDQSYSTEGRTSVTMVNCFRPWQMCVVNELGEVRPSDVYWKSVGSLRETNFAAIWNNWKYRLLRKSINSRPGSICRSCRAPQFDSDENRAAAQLFPSFKQQLNGFSKSLVRTKPRAVFSGIMDEEFDPTCR